MSFLPPEGPAPELSVTRVRSGRSARAMAAVVAALLIGVVGFVVVNRPPLHPPAPTPAVAAVAPTPSPSPTPLHNQIDGNGGTFGPIPTPISAPVVVPAARRYQYGATLLLSNGGEKHVPLEAAAPDTYRAFALVSLRDVGDALPIDVGRYSMDRGLAVYESFGSWQVALDELRASHRKRVTVLEWHQQPDTTPGLAGPLAGGYEFKMVATRHGKEANLWFEMVWPTTAQFASYTGPRGRGLFNRCRWGDGPQGAPPRGDHDEAGCLGN